MSDSSKPAKKSSAVKKSPKRRRLTIKPRPACRVCGETLFEYGIAPALADTGVCEHCYDDRARYAAPIFAQLVTINETFEVSALLALDAAEALIRALSTRPFGESARLELADASPFPSEPPRSVAVGDPEGPAHV